jgi:hypothetical protein
LKSILQKRVRAPNNQIIMSAVQTMIKSEEAKMSQLPDMDVVYRFLEETYSLERAEAEELLKKALSKPKTSKKKTEKKKAVEELPQPDVALPYCNVGVENQCKAVVLNNQLFTQCTHVVAGELDVDSGEKKISLCKGCLKSAKTRVKAGNKALTYGTIEERLANGGVYGNNGALRKPVCYASVMIKLGITRADAEAAAEKMGWTIPEEEFAAKPTARGRPKKSKKTEAVEVVADTSDSETDGEKQAAKKRGRPKKEKKVMNNVDGDDLITALVEEAQTKGDALLGASDEESGDETEKTVEESVDEIVKKQAVVMAGLPNETWKPTKKRVPVDAAAKKAEKAAAAEAKKAEKEAAAAAKKAEKEAAAQAKKAEKEAAAAAKKAEKEAAAAAKKAEKAAAAEAKKAKKAEVSPAPVADELEEESEEEDEEATQVEKWSCPADGKEYLRAADNVIYDTETHDVVGVWSRGG